MSEQEPVEITKMVGYSEIPTDPPCHWCQSPMRVRISSDEAGEWFLGQAVCTTCWSAGPLPEKIAGSQIVALGLAMRKWMDSPHGFEPRIEVLERMETARDEQKARADALAAEVERLTQRAEHAEIARLEAGQRGTMMEFACIADPTGRRTALLEAIDLIEQRAVDRGRQVDVAQAAGGAWEVVAGKSSELMAVADLLRARLPPSAGSATS